MIDQYVQFVGTDKLEEIKNFLLDLTYKARRGKITPDQFEVVIYAFLDKICEIYKNFTTSEEENIDHLKRIYQFDTAKIYCDTILSWIGEINKKVVEDFDDYKNKQKVKQAIIFIQENYNKNLNMAVVSNHVSMNYSLFSHSFKQYTRMNFVNYLKVIRINEAKRLLEETDKKIIEISSLVGYENDKNFMKVFRNVCGVSPSEYRRNVLLGKSNIEV